MKLRIRQGSIQDKDVLVDIEAKCFAKNEAATAEEIEERLRVFGDHFLILEADNEPVGFIDGFVTNEKDLQDEMYEKAFLHDLNGKWQMIFGLNTLPQYRNQGYGAMLVRAMIQLAEREKRNGIVLTCRKKLIPYYSRFGFENEGISNSLHGGGIWYQMRLTF